MLYLEIKKAIAFGKKRRCGSWEVGRVLGMWKLESPTSPFEQTQSLEGSIKKP